MNPIGYTWSLPLTLAGKALARVGRAYESRYWEGVWIYVPEPGGLLERWFTRHPGVRAFTWGAIVFMRSELYTRHPPTLRHERRHFVQACWWGPLLPLAYLIGMLWGYERNPFEVDARSAE
jgi:hypothetical protein